MKDPRDARDVYILGIGQTKFTKHPHLTAIDLGTIAAGEAIKDAGVDPRKFEVAYASRIEDASQTSQDILRHFGIEDIECHNCENACASGGSAVRLLYKDIAFGIYDIGIAVGTESLSTSRIAGGLVPTAKGAFMDLLGLPAPGSTAIVAQKLIQTRGCTMEDIAYAAWKNHRAAVFNPYAHYRRELTMDEIINSEMIASPTTKLMCCPQSDGAAAVILCTKEIAMRYTTKLVRIDACQQMSGNYSTYDEDIILSGNLTKLANLCYDLAGYGPDELALLEVHDAYSAEEITIYERLGLCKPYESVPLIRSGELEIGGRRPVNLSGGLLSMGHPLAASGVRVVVDITRQLRGEAQPELQVKNARTGLAEMIGGKLVGRTWPEISFVTMLSA